MPSIDTNWIELINDHLDGGVSANPLQCGGANQVAVQYQFAEGVSAGVVALEHSIDADFTGEWTVLDSQDASHVGGNAQAFFTYPGPLGFIRAHITTAISGGGDPAVVVRAKRLFSL